jgi:hypothetical protein
MIQGTEEEVELQKALRRRKQSLSVGEGYWRAGEMQARAGGAQEEMA